MTDDELIGYCDIHCETPRALFSGDQINRMVELAGRTPRRLSASGWFSMHEDMKVLVADARAKLKRATFKVVK